MSATEAQVKLWISEAVKSELPDIVRQAIAETHPCILDESTIGVLKDEDAMETLRTLGKGMSPNTASFITRMSRLVDQASFSLGSFILKAAAIAMVAIVVFMFFKKGELPDVP